MKKQFLAICSLCLLMATSCLNELTDKLDKIDSSSWNPALASPLLNGDFTMGEMANELSRNNLRVSSNNEGVTTLVYRQPPIVSQTAAELITFDSFSFNERLELGTDVAALPSVNQVIKFDNDHRETISTNENDKLYKVELKGGSLNINLSGNIPASGKINFIFHSLIKEGQKLALDYEWSSASSQSYTNNIDLTDYLLDLSENNTSSNQFLYSSSIELNYEGQSLSATDGFDVDISINNLAFYYLEGSLANRTIISDEQYFKMGFNDEIRNGEFYINEPAFHLFFRNSIGAPIEANIDYITAESKSKGTLALTGDIVSKAISMAYPTQRGLYETTELIVDETNSNLADIIAFQSDSIKYAVPGSVAPADPDEVHFVTDTSMIMVDVITEIPLHGYINRLRLAEPYDFDGSFAEDVDNAIIHITGANSLPADARIQAYFVNVSDLVVDSLIYDKELLLEAATSDLNGKVDSPTNIEKSIVMDKSRLSKIVDAEKLILVAILNTPLSPAQSVKFYEHNKLNIKLSAQTKFKIDF